MKVVIVSGYFDPIHKGHLAMFREARALGDKLIVIVNNDEQAIAKKGYAFMPAKERANIIGEMKCVDIAVVAIDKDKTVCESLRTIVKLEKGFEYIFANGGDRFEDNVPEKQVCEELGVKMAFNVGGDKAESSSNLVNRVWGHWEVLDTGKGYKIKILNVLPHKELSYQRHFRRSEHWVVIEGVATVAFPGGMATVDTNESYYIGREDWHQLINETDDLLRVVEISTGDYIEEDDIERLTPVNN